MTLPDALIALATLGTAHGPSALPPPPTALGELLGQVEGPPEAQILLLAGALSLQEKAGRLPLRPEAPLPLPSEPDDRPSVPAEAARHLLQMLGGEHKEVLPEWLAAAHARGQRTPDELLPYLLDLGLKRAELRPPLFALLGPRAVWLAEQAGMGPWAYFRLGGVETVWQEAETQVRVALLAHLRWRDPARGRELLVSTWPSEGARQREQFLKELDQGLSIADELFLEEALDDRAAGVRAAAVELLARLPGSAFNRRMAERATALLSLQRTWRGRRLLLDEEAIRFDKAMTRDGLVKAPPASSKLSPAGWLLQQVLAYVPPGHWLQQWELGPDELFDVVSHAPEEIAFLRGLAWAAYRASDADFASLLVREVLSRLPSELLPLLLVQLPVTAVNTVLLPWLQRRREPFSPEHPVIAALLAYRRPWSRELAAAVVTAITRMPNPDTMTPQRWIRQALLQFVLYWPPADGAALLASFAGQPHPALQAQWKPVVDEMRLTLEFRRRMLAALSEL